MTYPWLPYLVIDYIEKLKPKKVFEWGSGNSTLFFLQMGVKKLVTIEHELDWFHKVNKLLSDNNIIHLNNRLIPFQYGSLGSDPGNPNHYKSGSTELGEVNFKEYVTVIDEYEDFDFILIDGMARAACIKHAFKHVSPGGAILIDNTGDRPYYLSQNIHLFGNYESGWERLDFLGYGPIIDYKWQSTFFINRKKEDYETNHSH